MKFDSRFENPETWNLGRYLANENEMKRFTATMNLVPSEAESLLDVGTGNGAFLHILEENRALRLRGIDSSPTAIASRACSAEITEAPITKIPFPDRSFDIVSALEVIEHLNCTEFPIAIEELQRVSSRYILISAPYKNAIFEMCQCPYCESIFQIYGHLQRFDESRIAGLFTAFEMQAWKVVMTRGKYPIRNPLRRERWSSMPSAMQCPLCEYRSPAEKSTGVSTRPTLKSKIKNMLPEREVPNWIVGFYERKS
jgi:SAM-dependent methyltransferase